MKNVFEAADTRQKQAKKRSLYGINEHFALVFNIVAATQIVFQRPARVLLRKTNPESSIETAAAAVAPMTTDG